MLFRPYDPARDAKDVERIWRECGWLTDDDQLPAVNLYFNLPGHCVGELDGAAECSVITSPGSIRYLDTDLPFSGVLGVTTSRIARRQGMAGRLTAKCVADAAAQGAAVSGLGAFEHGFYDRLGFGAGSYEHFFEFDPTRLVLPKRAIRPSRRLTTELAVEVHANRNARRLVHGAVRFDDVRVTEGNMRWDKSFGVGFFDGPGGALSHHLWCYPKGDAETGPYRVEWLAYSTHDQLLELLGVLRSWGDQMRCIHMAEPPGVQFQRLLLTPHRITRMTEGSPFRQRQWFTAWWQMRMCDVERCVSALRVPAGPVTCNVELHDPIEPFLDADAPWRGVGGTYRVTFGPTSAATRGADPSLPTLRASVNAFTRLWLGAETASGIAVTDELSGPDELLAQLDEVLRLPSPTPDWEF